MFPLRIINLSLARCIPKEFMRFNRDRGIAHRKKLVSLDVNEAQEDFDFEDFESDFMSAHKSHKQHIDELELTREREKYLIVGQKYFKEKLPNFLTWHDKEQIRYLHQTSPEEWTVEQLAEGFPATPDIIQKIIKSKFTKTQSKITSHDRAVENNWKLFKQGKIPNLPPHLKEHLQKFTDRSHSFKKFTLPDTTKTIEVKNDYKAEFTEIITSYQQLKNKDKDSQQPVLEKIKSVPPLSETYLTSKIGGSKHSLTLSALKDSVLKKVEKGQDLTAEDKLILTEIKTTENKIQPVQVDLNEVTPKKYSTPKAVAVNSISPVPSKLLHLNYPEKIKIPKSLWKKDHLYKLKDCYYDDDGQFLYRVPGME